MIELKNVSYIVEDHGEKKAILDNISCVFDDACLTAVTGENGSGKSTLMKIVVGILKPTEGKVFMDGKDITNLTIDERARKGINYAFQQPVLFNGLTVKDLIDLATKKENSVGVACNYLSKVGICAKVYINRPFDKTLSGGEQKRIEIALALAKKGKVYIFDEPEAGIDLWSFEKLNNIFDKEKCNIVVSHQEKLLKTADKILVLNHGKIEKFGSAKQVLKNLGKKCSMMEGGDVR
ncbi:MAG: ATP-binding cassette domain-containing protein [Clostridiales bacterium]|nr:ATP-binding cassette domain-containing protein [Clostridiales bacterium]